MIGENGNTHFQSIVKCSDWGCFSFIEVSSVMSSVSRSQPNMSILVRRGSRNMHWLRDLTVAACALIHWVKCLEIPSSCKFGKLCSARKKFLYPSSVILWFTERSKFSSFWKPPLSATLAIKAKYLWNQNHQDFYFDNGRPGYLNQPLLPSLPPPPLKVENANKIF